MRWRATVLCIGLLASGSAVRAQDSLSVRGQRDAQATFDVLKGLAGQWTGTVTTDPHNPDIEGAIQVTMRVAARGNVLEHEIAPGGVPEPTMIFVEGDHLALVHYCEAGNRPRLIARGPADPKKVDFEFADISGSREPLYLKDFVFTIVNANHHVEDWTFQMPDDQKLVAHFDLNRAAAGRSKPAGR